MNFTELEDFILRNIELYYICIFVYVIVVVYIHSSEINGFEWVYSNFNSLDIIFYCEFLMTYILYRILSPS